MANRLSFSSAKMMMDCGKSYEYHYIKRIRPTTIGAALIFGTAVDRAATVIFQPEDSKKTAEQVFEYFWQWQEINGKNVYLPKCIDVVYPESDFDVELLSRDAIQLLKDEYKVNDIKDEISKLLTWKKEHGWAALPTEQKVLVNHTMWLIYKLKGLLMLKAIRTKIMPQIEKVLATQLPTKIENEIGDSVTGFIDLIAMVKGYPTPVILDLKTSKMIYADSSNEVSPQLASYLNSVGEQFGTRLVGFLVLNKTVAKNKIKICSVCGFDGSGSNHKNCPNEVKGTKTNKKGEVVECTVRCSGEWNITLDPEIYTQIIISELPQQTEDIVIQNYDHVNEMIKQNSFSRNFSSCTKPWGRCVYWKLCYEASKEGLIKLEERKSES
jgi:hypothetical protein